LKHKKKGKCLGEWFKSSLGFTGEGERLRKKGATSGENLKRKEEMV